MTKKEKLIEDILENPTYMSNSGLIEQLRKALSKLSERALWQLFTIIECKVNQ